MAPLLGRKPYPLVKPLAPPPGPEEQVWTIQHSQEAFRNKEDYEARLQRYAERIWTCKSTGSSQLTHKEAWDEEQEVTELLQEEWPLWFEKPVLELVHHNTISLDKLVDLAWVEILTKYAVGEECDFLVGKDKSLRVTIVKIHPLEVVEGEAAEKKLEGACDSPSSDKENASQENQKKEPSPREEEPPRRESVRVPREETSRRESLSDRARRSPRKQPGAAGPVKEEKKKWVMPKFLPHKYDVKLVNEAKVISDVPTDSLFRSERPPTKEIMRYFIRHYAIRLGLGETAPWVVEDQLVKKFNLPSKFSDFLLDPHKFLAENPSTKRKSLTSPEGKPNKKLKTSDTSGEEEKSGKKRKKKDSLGMPLSPTLWNHMQKVKMNGSPLKVKNGTPKKEGKSSAPSTPKSGKKPGDKKPDGRKNRKNINGLKASKNEKAGGIKKPKMKQMTLLHLAKSPPPAGSPKKRPRSTGPGTPKLGKPLHPMALHLLRYYKEHKGREERRNAMSSLISKAAKALSPDERDRLPEELRDLVQKRWELLEQKRRWAAMTEEEKQDVMRKKREEIKEKLREKAKERRVQEMLVRREQQRRYEDQDIQGKTLPTLKLVDMPEGLPNALFGDIAMVADFLNCYAGLLMPDDQYPITSAALMEALAGEAAGFHYLNRVLVVLLQTLLQDELAEGYSELDMPLSEIPLTMHSVSELVRLCLRPCDAAAGGSGQGSDDPWALGGFDDVVTSEFLERLETVEVFELEPEEKVSLLVALCHRILMTYSVEDHVDAMQQRSAELWKERLASLKEVNDRKRAEKQRRKEQVEGGAAGSGTPATTPKPGNTPSTTPKGGSARKGGSVKKELKEAVVALEVMDADMISSVKSRRLMAIQAKKDKEEHDRQNKERMEKEAEEERVRKQKASAERAFQDGISKAKLVLRRAPLGTDRNHSRYWLFSDVVPGLYIEKGWVHESIDYSYTPPEEDKPAPPSDPLKAETEEEVDEEGAEGVKEEEDEEEEGSIDGSEQQGAPALETSVPKQGQNLWFVCDTPAELDLLMESLHPQGVRESELKNKLQVQYQDVLHSMYLARKGKAGLRACDGPQELLKYMRSDILEVASRLTKGGLGCLDDDASDLKDKVQEMESLKDFGECVITIQACVVKKFFQGFMAPKQKKRRKHGGEDSAKAEEVDEEKKLAEEARVATAVERWRVAIREAQTFSRMHVLLGMLDACINWDMSAENARCKVCRKKEFEKLILCDECNKAYHLYCLRPILHRIPAGEWLCPACQPTLARRTSRARNYKEDTEEEEDEESEEESEDEDDDDDDYKAMGHSLRPRKKTKQPSSRSKGSSKGGSKKTSPSSGRGGKQKARPTEPTSPADIDELVRQSSKSGVSKHVLEIQRCEEIIQKLVKFRYSWPFREPVSVDEAEDYLDVISSPMDFQTMLDKFSEGQYRHTSDFLEDVRLVFSNAEEYNQAGSSVLTCMARTEQAFTELLHKLLPGLSYLRRRQRKRLSHSPVHSPQVSEEEEEEEEQEQKQKPKKMENGSKRGPGRPKKAVAEPPKKGRPSAKRREEEEEESEEEDSEEDSEEESGGAKRKQSKRASASKKRRDEEEEESEEEGSPKRKSKSKRVPPSKKRRDEDSEEGGTPTKKRGRPSVKRRDEEEESEEEDSEESGGAKRKQSKRASASKKGRDEEEEESEEEGSPKSKSKRAPPSKKNRDEDSEEGATPTKKRGRPSVKRRDGEEESEEKGSAKTKKRGRPSTKHRDKEEESAEESDGAKRKSKRASASRKRRDEDDREEEGGAKRKKRGRLSTKRQDEEEEEDSDSAKKRSKRVVTSSRRRDYCEQESDSEGDSRTGRGGRRRGGGGSSDEYKPSQRHSKRQKRPS